MLPKMCDIYIFTAQCMPPSNLMSLHPWGLFPKLILRTKAPNKPGLFKLASRTECVSAVEGTEKHSSSWNKTQIRCHISGLHTPLLGEPLQDPRNKAVGERIPRILEMPVLQIISMWRFRIWGKTGKCVAGIFCSTSAFLGKDWLVVLPGVRCTASKPYFLA